VAVDLVGEAQRPQNELERLPDRDVFQLADERPIDAGIGNDAQARAADEEQQQVLDRHRLREGEREGAVVEVGRQLPLIELRQRQRRHLAGPHLGRLHRQREDHPHVLHVPDFGSVFRLH